MSRRKAAPVRVVLPDPLFKSEMLAKFVNVMMKAGKKSVAERIMYNALDHVVKTMRQRVKNQPAESRSSAKHESKDDGESGSGESGRASEDLGVMALLAQLKDEELNIRTSAKARAVALDLFKEALEKVTPVVEVRSRRVGGSTYQVPVEIRAKRRMALAMRWIVTYANDRHEKTMVLRLANEVMDAMAGRGNAVKKREDVYRMAKANQAFAHYRW
jgi:small subunit ribosomal protein S7